MDDDVTLAIDSLGDGGHEPGELPLPLLMVRDVNMDRRGHAGCLASLIHLRHPFILARDDKRRVSKPYEERIVDFLLPTNPQVCTAHLND